MSRLLRMISLRTKGRGWTQTIGTKPPILHREYCFDAYQFCVKLTLLTLSTYLSLLVAMPKVRKQPDQRDPLCQPHPRGAPRACAWETFHHQVHPLVFLMDEGM